MKLPLEKAKIDRMAERAATVHRLNTETNAKCSRSDAAGPRYVCSVGKKGAAHVEFLCGSCNGKRAAKKKAEKKESAAVQEVMFK